ncbi:MAG: VCBS repeat-containing protein [candidate division KSB1 bacterium]|nr:VCBS repeat-containing protein [candidate division KSB1 bacterium]MDZ7317894.1 VCBS repeat-containing protein [candidate division KSB1 bacterium]MDZ7341734.1 VCBS repeat-containing protein [candidate division KSB1 bacterium]
MHLKILNSTTILFACIIGIFAVAEPILAQVPNAGTKIGCENVSTAISMTSQFTSTPTFTAAMRLKANGVDMKVDTYTSVPCVVDWNGDGKKDLLVGCFYYGNVYLFLNSGSDSAPVFTTGTKLKADGLDLSVAYG